MIIATQDEVKNWYKDNRKNIIGWSLVRNIKFRNTIITFDIKNGTNKVFKLQEFTFVSYLKIIRQENKNLN